ncbi:hypothetical protein AAVH_22392 [Aphelenchoides avenae]|nr:hypothetical protein AAVH_22392 [Aphelenchus avenae]
MAVTKSSTRSQTMSTLFTLVSAMLLLLPYVVPRTEARILPSRRPTGLDRYNAAYEVESDDSGADAVVEVEELDEVTKSMQDVCRKNSLRTDGRRNDFLTELCSSILFN